MFKVLADVGGYRGHRLPPPDHFGDQLPRPFYTFLDLGTRWHRFDPLEAHKYRASCLESYSVGFSWCCIGNMADNHVVPSLANLPAVLAAVQGMHLAVLADCGAARAAILRRRDERRRRRRATWVDPWLMKRVRLGWYHTLMVELEREHTSHFKNFLRVTPAHFDELLARITPRIERCDTNYRAAIPPGMKLAITLRFLATGNSYASLAFGFRVAKCTIGVIVPVVCQAIITEFQDEVVSTPRTPDDWRAVARGFSNRWNFQHCLGALDGKHVAIRCPRNGGSLFYNYKGFHSIVMMALVDSDYKFIWVDIGSYGSASDAQIFNHSELYEMIEDRELGFPAAEPLVGDDEAVPYFLIGDDAFALQSWMMKPFSRRNMQRDERIFNYRLSRARRVVENAFGILAQRFGCLLRTLPQQPVTVQKVVMACVVLHNILRERNIGRHNRNLDEEDVDHNVIPGAWRQAQAMHDMEELHGGNRQSRLAKRQRLLLKHYYNNGVGAVEWQDAMI